MDEFIIIDELKTEIDNTETNISASITDTKNTINSNVSSVKTTVTSNNTLLNNSTYGLSAIKNALGNGSVKVIKNVQRGSLVLNGTNSKTTYISSVNINKSILLFSVSNSSNITNDNIARALAETNVSGQLSNSTTLTFAVGRNPAADITIEWQVLECY